MLESIIIGVSVSYLIGVHAFIYAERDSYKYLSKVRVQIRRNHNNRYNVYFRSRLTLPLLWVRYDYSLNRDDAQAVAAMLENYYHNHAQQNKSDMVYDSCKGIIQ